MRSSKEPQTLTDSLDKLSKRQNVDMRFRTWNVRSFYRAGSLVTVSRELFKCKLDLVGVQVRWEGSGTEPAEEYTFFYRRGIENHELVCFCIRESSAVKRVEFVSGRMIYTILRGHTPTEDKKKDSFYEELESVFDKFPKYHRKILLGDLNAKVGREDISKPTIGNESLHEISNDNGVRLANFATSKNLRVKIWCSHIATSINILGRLQMGKPTIRLTIFW
jgi:hypothetical protein